MKIKEENFCSRRKCQNGEQIEGKGEPAGKIF